MSMASHLRRVAVIGAGGLLGAFLLKALRADPFFTVTVITRHSSTSNFDPDLRVIKVADDYPQAEMLEALKGQDVVVATFNYRANPFKKGIIDAAADSLVKRIIPPHIIKNNENAAVLELQPRLKDKNAEVDHLRAKESMGMTWTSIVTGLFLDVAVANGFMGFDLRRREATIWDSGDGQFSCSIRPTIGATVVAVLKRPDLTKNRYIYTSSFETSQNEILHSLERQTGGIPWKVGHVTSENMIKEGQEASKRGDFMGMGKLALAASFSGKYGGNFAAEGKLANEILGIPREDLDQVLADVLQSS